MNAPIANPDAQRRLSEARCYALHDTTIEKGGVVRCCLGTVAEEYEGKQVRLGDKSKCQHCGTTFTLVMVPPGIRTCYTQEVTKITPVWKPDWQLKEHNDQALRPGRTETKL
jgi:hypothetical protein